MLDIYYRNTVFAYLLEVYRLFWWSHNRIVKTIHFKILLHWSWQNQWF